MLALQGAAGNRAVANLLGRRRPPLQRLAVADDHGPRDLEGIGEGPSALDAATEQVDAVKAAAAPPPDDEATTPPTDGEAAAGPPPGAPGTGAAPPEGGSAQSGEAGEPQAARADGALAVLGGAASRPALDELLQPPSIVQTPVLAGGAMDDQSMVAPLAVRPETLPTRAVPALEEKLPVVQRVTDTDLETTELTSIDTTGLEADPTTAGGDGGIREAGSAMAAGAPAGGGSLLDAAASAAMSLLQSAYSAGSAAATTGAAASAGEVEQGRAEAGATATAATAEARAGVEQEGQATAVGAQAIVGEAGGEARSEVASLGSFVRGFLQRMSGGLRDRVQAWLRTAGSDEDFIESIVAPVRQAILERIATLQAMLNRIRARLMGFVAAAGAALMGVVTRLGAALTNAITAISSRLQAVVARVSALINGVIDTVTRMVRALPDAVASLVSGLVNRLLLAARRVVNLVITAARNVIDRVTAVLVGLVRRIQSGVLAVIMRIQAALTRIIDRVIAAIQRFIVRIVDAARRAIDWVRTTIRSIVQGVMKAVLGVVRAALEKWLEPQIKGAMDQAKAAYAAFQAMLPELRRMAAQAQAQMEASLRTGIDRMTSLGGSAVQNLMNPDGDHFAIGGQVNAELFGGVASANASAGFVYDFVADYAHNQIGIFFTISFGVGANAGAGASAEADAGVQMGWGTVMNMKSKSDIDDALGGYNAVLGVGVSATAEVEAGVAVATGHSFTMSLDTLDTVLCPPAPSPVPVPGGAGGGAGAGGGGAGGAATVEHHPLSNWTVLFPTGQADLDGTDLGVIAMAADEARRVRAERSGALRLVVDGHSSPRFRHPSRGADAGQENQGLSGDRARRVSTDLSPRFGSEDRPVNITASGRGTELATREGAGADSDDQRYRAATISGEVVSTRPTAGSGPGPTGAAPAGGPPTRPGAATPSTLAIVGCRAAKEIPLPPGVGPQGSLDAYLRARPYGWDTALYGGVAVGAGASVGAGTSVGLSRSIPLWKTQLSKPVMTVVRLLFGLFKLALDVVTASPVSFIRDAIAVAPAVESAVLPLILGPLSSIEIPMPDK